MSRLDSAIRRLEAQRACLGRAIELVADVDGVVLELGLGNGRTYDHLREQLPGRRIYVFERKVAAHPDCIPPDDRLFEGDFRHTLPGAGARIGEAAALIHADIGSGDKPATAAVAAFISPYVNDVLAPGGIVAADQPLGLPACEALPLPPGIAPGRYHLYRKATVG